ncbi:MAG: 16S rRNA (guanine(527)-N(7))-methyltransferase RsmG [Armatimonadetes bacterium]|nr:16S rRNA (guanine(527)-N(7))-methyltransferase RsmG [Armatimonadota bacterium]
MSGAAKLGIALDDDQAARFDAFTALLLEWNERVNLTRIVEPSEIALKHYLDSLSLLSVLDVPSGASLLDVGSGAGIPAIPLAIARPDLRITVLDSVRKKLAFVEVVLRELGISEALTVHARAEDAARDKAHRERYGLVAARAVARLPVLAELCIPFCRVGGWFAAYKGPAAAGEVADAGNAIRALGGGAPRAEAFSLPGTGDGRTIVLVRKERRTPPAYPRKAGVPSADPL